MSRIYLADGQEIEVDALTDYDQARRLLDQLDREIITIEQQLSDGPRPGLSTDWLARARSAMKHRKRLRPLLQEKIGQLKRVKALAGHNAVVMAPRLVTDKRAAFMKAAVAELPREEFNRIMGRAREMFPAAFVSEGEQ